MCTVYSVQCARILHLELPSAQWVPKKAEGRDMPKRHPCHLFPRPIKPQPLRSLIGGSLADSVGFHVCHIAATSFIWPAGWLGYFSYSATREHTLERRCYPWAFCFIQPTSTASFASQPTTPSQFEKPSKHLFTCDFCLPRQTCFGSESKWPVGLAASNPQLLKTSKNNLKPTGIYVSHCQFWHLQHARQLLPQVHRCYYTTSGISKDLWHGKPFHWRKRWTKTNLIEMARGIIPSALLARAKFCLQHCKPWETSEAKTRNNGRLRSRSFAPWFFKRFRCTEPSSGFGVL